MNQNKLLNAHNIVVGGQFLYVDQDRYASGKFHHATPLFVRAILGSRIITANIEELDDSSLNIWYSYHPSSQVPQILVRTLHNLSALDVAVARYRSLIIPKSNTVPDTPTN